MPPSGTLPDPEVIRQTAQEVVERPAYRLDAVPEGGLTLREIVRAIIDFFEWITTPLRGLFEVSPVFAWVVVLTLILLLALILGHLIYTFAAVFQRRKRAFELPDDVEAGARPEMFEQQAQQAVAAGDYIQAVRLLFRACLVRLEQAEERPLRRGLTNREYLRRYEDTLFHEPLVPFVNTIDRKWYGGGECRAEDYEQCAHAHAEVQRAIREVGHAQRA